MKKKYFEIFKTLLILNIIIAKATINVALDVIRIILSFGKISIINSKRDMISAGCMIVFDINVKKSKAVPIKRENSYLDEVN